MLLTVATPLGGQGGQSATPDSEKFANNREKEEKNQEESGKKRKNREEKAKIGTVLSLCPTDRQGWLLYSIKQWLSNLLLICKLQ